MTTKSVSAPRGIDAVYYMIQDISRARRFYEEALGFEPAFVSDAGDWLGAEYLLPTGQTFGIGKSDAAPFRPSGGMMLSVHDVAEATRRVAGAGGKVLQEPM